MIKTPLTSWAVPVLITVLCAVLYAVQDTVLMQLEFNRELIAKGEYWRLLTGNFLHTNHWHLLFNLVGLLFLSYMYNPHFPPLKFSFFVLTNAALLGCALYLFSPNIELYVGLSGVLHGLFVYGCLSDIKTGDKVSYVLLGAVIAKVVYESIYGASVKMSELIDANVATDAHLFGALIAIISFLTIELSQRLKRVQSY
ncbi:rhombosortase [Psychrobium sp. 1_MG-2023]|uniref:rhombosortase n=1 Tax=Psychrobium sp. 1_MG-2023 TaxID=3062624 RepID=UPI000C33F778|nr:rhombosortase [Psychrobium sp. 1_MG-2023]MDP2562704.1 rhombosortase [Psychrobium sp. 1_MG-2023]PKF54032.1 rhombosortase [Alteromonadales bacterium alter-6D02]